MNNLKNVLIGLGLIAGFIMTGCEEDDNGESQVEEENSSEFFNDADGWTIAGDAEGGSNIEAAYSPIEGLDNSGYIYAEDDVTGGVWYFVAPDKYEGDKSAYVGGSLSFWMIQKSAMDDQFDARDIIIEGSNENEIYYHDMSYPDTSWTEYSIALDTSINWMVAEEDTASMTDIEAVLSNVQQLSIRGEFETGPDTGGLDKFEITE